MKEARELIKKYSKEKTAALIEVIDAHPPKILKRFRPEACDLRCACKCWLTLLSFVEEVPAIACTRH